MKSFIPKTRFSGLVITIVLLIVLTIGLFTFVTYYRNEERIVKRGFITLRQNAESIKLQVATIAATKRFLKTRAAVPHGNPGNYNNYLKIDSNGIVTDFSTAKPDSCNDAYSSNDFFSNLLDKSFFDEYIVFKEKKLLYKTFSAEPEPMTGDYLSCFRKSLYVPSNYNILSGKKDSVLISGGWNAGFISKVDIGYTKYFLFVYPVTVNNQRWYIGGLLTNENFQAKKRSVERWLLIFICIVLVFTLFSFQFVKLFLLSKTERVKITDMVFLWFSISGVACVVTLLFLNFLARSDLMQNTESQLKALNSAIKQSFVEELGLMYDVASDYEKVIEKSKDRNFEKNLHILSSESHGQYISGINAIKKYPYFKSVFKADTGWNFNILSTWENDARSKISSRRYYEKKDEWIMPNRDNNARFRLESIYSNTTGDALAVLAKPSSKQNTTVYAVSSPCYSIMKTVLPPGCEFRVIDADGKVWFHNEERKNNRDNLLEEADFDPDLKEAIQNRTQIAIPLKVSEKNYIAYISPIEKLPLFLITLSKQDEQNAYLSHVNYMFFIFIFLGILWGLAAYTVFYYEKLGKYIRGIEDQDQEPGIIWLLPDTRKNARYVLIALLNVLMTLIITIPAILRETSVLQLVLVLFCAFSLSGVYIYFFLKPFKKRVFKWSLPIMLFVVVIVCNVLYYHSTTSFSIFLLIEILLIVFLFTIVGSVVPKGKSGGLLLVFKPVKRIIGRTTSFIQLKMRKPSLPYLLFLTTWVVLSAILPVLLILKCAGNEEVEILTKKNQLEIARKIEARNLEIDSAYIKHIYPQELSSKGMNLDGLKDSLKDKGVYLLDFGVEHVSNHRLSINTVKPPDNKSEAYFPRISTFVNLLLSNEEDGSKPIESTSSEEPLWSWRGGYLGTPKSDNLKFVYIGKSQSRNKLFQPETIEISSVLASQKSNTLGVSWHTFLLISLFLIVLLVFLFILLKGIVKRLFILRKPGELNMLSHTQLIKESGRLFLINSLNQDFIMKVLNSYSTMSVEELKKPDNETNVLILLNVLPSNYVSWKQTIDTLGDLVRSNVKHLVILSCFSPVQIKAMLDKQIAELENAEKSALSPDDKKENHRYMVELIDLNKTLILLFSSFTVCFQHNPKEIAKLEGFINECLTYVPARSDKEELKNYLEDELKFAAQFMEKREWLTEFFTDEMTVQELKLKLYNLLIPFYQQIWEYCTEEEKFILYDMSVDTLLNTNNKEEIKNLLGKGILEVNGRLDYLSQGFKRYVSDLADAGEFINMEIAAKQAGGWNNVRGPLYFIFFTIVALVFFTQQDFISTISGTVISMAGLLGVLIKFGLFGKTGDAGK